MEELVDASMKFTRVLKRKGVSQATLQVAVRARPLSRKEMSNGARTITKLVDERCVVVLDPDEDANESTVPGVPKPLKRKEVAAGVRKKERRYVFDAAYDGEASNEQVYRGTVLPHIAGVLRGTNATVFAYGATGSGKTHTMVGDQRDPGLMVLSLRDVFRFIASDGGEKDYKVECSYTEVYNELVYDLLVPNSPALELREDPERGPMVSGLTHVAVDDENAIFELLRKGNARRKTEETGANAVSSRSHAVLEIWVTRTERNHYCKAYTTGKLALVDLAGAERASETNNRGHQLRDGANINRSLLSLANCINALGKRKKKGFVFVPFRDSKLTRILKDGLCGNSRTVMVATVSGSSHQYEHTVNTLKYADRAKEIKTHVHENRGTVETHIAEYQRMIDALQEERRELRAEVDRLKGGGGGGGRVGVGGPSNGFAAAVNGGRVPRESGGNGGWNGGGHEQGLTVEEVEKFAQELAEATDACAKAQRVLLERQTREASARAAAAASALEALAPTQLCSGPAGTDAGKRPTGPTDRVAAAAAGKKKSVGFFGFGLGGKGGGGGGDAGADAGSDAGSDASSSFVDRPVLASDLAVLHARASLAVAADLDAAALETRDRLIKDQRRAIAALMSALGPAARESRLDLPARCAPSQLEERYRALVPNGGKDGGVKEGGGVGPGGGSNAGGGSVAASVLPVDAIRVEAEALAARARAAEESRHSTPDGKRSAGSGSGSERGSGSGGHQRRDSIGAFELEYSPEVLEMDSFIHGNGYGDGGDEGAAGGRFHAGPLSPVAEAVASSRANVFRQESSGPASSSGSAGERSKAGGSSASGSKENRVSSGGALAQEKRSKKKLEEAHAIYGQNAQQKRRGGAISERLKRLAGRKSKSASPSSD